MTEEFYITYNRSSRYTPPSALQTPPLREEAIKSINRYLEWAVFAFHLYNGVKIAKSGQEK